MYCLTQMFLSTPFACAHHQTIVQEMTRLEVDATCIAEDEPQQQREQQDPQLPQPLPHSWQPPRLPRITSAALCAFSEERGFALGLGVYLRDTAGDISVASGCAGLFEVGGDNCASELGCKSVC